jgi:hypothetical protein
MALRAASFPARGMQRGLPEAARRARERIAQSSSEQLLRVAARACSSWRDARAVGARAGGTPFARRSTRGEGGSRPHSCCTRASVLAESPPTDRYSTARAGGWVGLHHAPGFAPGLPLLKPRRAVRGTRSSSARGYPRARPRHSRTRNSRTALVARGDKSPTSRSRR